MKILPLIYPSVTLCWVFKEENFYSKSFSQTIGKHIPHSYLKEFFPETSFLGKFEGFF